MKKLLAVLIVLALMLSLSLVVVASDPPTGNPPPARGDIQFVDNRGGTIIVDPEDPPTEPPYVGGNWTGILDNTGLRFWEHEIATIEAHGITDIVFNSIRSNNTFETYSGGSESHTAILVESFNNPVRINVQMTGFHTGDISLSGQNVEGTDRVHVLPGHTMVLTRNNTLSTASDPNAGLATTITNLQGAGGTGANLGTAQEVTTGEGIPGDERIVGARYSAALTVPNPQNINVGDAQALILWSVITAGS